MTHSRVALRWPALAVLALALTLGAEGIALASPAAEPVDQVTTTEDPSPPATDADQTDRGVAEKTPLQVTSTSPATPSTESSGTANPSVASPTTSATPTTAATNSASPTQEPAVNTIPDTATLTLSPTQVTTIEKFTLTVTWTSVGKPASGEAQIQRLDSAGRWVKVADVTINNGTGSTQMTAASTRTLRAVAGTAISKTAVITVVPKDSVTLALSSARVTKSQPFAATVSWTTDGKATTGTAQIQRLDSAGRWVKVADVPVSKGVGTAQLTAASTRQLRVAAGNATSAAQTVTVVPLDKATLALNPTTIAPNGTTTATVTWTRDAAAFTGDASLWVQDGSAWKWVKTFPVSKGKATLTIRPPGTRTYRVKAGNTFSTPAKVTVATKPIPATFTIGGSGYGHGVGMSQYGAYQLALSGKSASQILATYFTGAKVQSASMSGNIRMQVYADSPSVDVLVAGGSSKVRGVSNTSAMRSAFPSGSLYQLKAGSGGTIEVRRSGVLIGRLPKGGKMIIQWEGTRFWPSSRAGIAYLRKAGSTTAASHGTYRRGRLEIRNIGGRVNVVNVLKMNTEYLWGLGEMPSSWGLGKGNAALQAQAIAARGYAAMQPSVKSSCDCQVYDDTRSQYFTGWKKESGANGSYWVKAVNATTSNNGNSGQVMTVGGKVVQAFYFSASGGATLNSEDVWSATIPYLRSVKDPYSLKAPGNPNVSWTASVSQAKAKALFPTLANVSTLKVSATYAGGGAKTLTATDTNGKSATYTAKSDKIRSALGLKSAWITSIKPG